MKIKRISYSALDSWKTCPLQFKLVEAMPRYNNKNEYLTVGNVLHKALYEYYDEGNVASLKELFHKQWIKDGLADKRLYEEGMKMATEYEQKFPTKNEIIARECRFEIDIGLSVPVVGFIDRIDRIEDEYDQFDYEIVDYKTGNYIPTQEDVDNNYQLSIYDWAFRKMWEAGDFGDIPEPIDVKLSLIYLRGDRISTYRSDEDREFIEEYMKVVTQEIIAAKDATPNLNPFCPNCIVKGECPLYANVLTVTPNYDSIQNMSEDELLKEYKELGMRNKIIEKHRDSLGAEIIKRMDAEDTSYIEGDNWKGTTYTRKNVNYDVDKVKAVLEPIGLFTKVVVVNNTKLKDMMESHGLKKDLLLGTYNTTSSKPIINANPLRKDPKEEIKKSKAKKKGSK